MQSEYSNKSGMQHPLHRLYPKSLFSLKTEREIIILTSNVTDSTSFSCFREQRSLTTGLRGKRKLKTTSRSCVCWSKCAFCTGFSCWSDQHSVKCSVSLTLKSLLQSNVCRTSTKTKTTSAFTLVLLLFFQAQSIWKLLVWGFWSSYKHSVWSTQLLWDFWWFGLLKRRQQSRQERGEITNTRHFCSFSFPCRMLNCALRA